MFCQNCGAPLNEGSKFCLQCGTPAAVETAVEPVAEAAETAEAVEAVETAETPVTETPVEAAALPAEPEAVPAAETAEPAAPLPSYDDGGYTYYSDDTVPEAAEVPKKKKKHLRWILPVAIVTAVLLLAAAGWLLYQKLYNTPERQVATAAMNSYDALKELPENCGNLMTLGKNAAEILAAGQYDMLLRIDSGEGMYAQSYDLVLQRDADTIRGDFTITMPYWDMETGIGLSMDSEALLLQINGKLFRVPTQNFGTEFADSTLADSLREYGYDLDGLEELESMNLDPSADTSIGAFIAGEPEALTRFKESIALSDTEEIIPEAPELKTFRMDMDMIALVDLVEAYYQFSMEVSLGDSSYADKMLEDLDLSSLRDEINEAQPYVLLGINEEKQLTALYITGENEDEPATILLCGETNPWTRIELYNSGELETTLVLTKTATGLEIDINDGDAIFCIDDAKGVIEFAEYGEPYFSLNYAATEQGLSLTAEEEDMAYSFSLEPVTEAVAPLEGEPLELLDMTLDELAEIFMQME